MLIFYLDTMYKMSVASILSGTPANISSPVLFESRGASSIALGTNASAQIANPLITASSVVCVSRALADLTCLVVSATLSAGVGFTVQGSANATALLPVSWAILSY